ncbi:stage III sporulation protein AD [Flavonifractor sp. An92]|uniref:SpoIIIAC/SpoIIIAD family protein n=1 Tax=Flavonifractor sp. An92 TaxID=1965666 RepID=UPI000B36BBDA|nr:MULTISPECIES: SpoIIIAC/SpoIIIAD family protein [unclassified Flavonifractor]OUN04183.1 stage III sporulation protein AD [Flavonifractor sp. An92]OUQ21446.1 stage III sporulation protein AD [Flavonifractor sp. An135]
MIGMEQVAVVAIVGALCAVVIKPHAREIALAVSLCAGAVILLGVLQAAGEIRELFSALAEAAGLAPAVLSPMLKTVGISILTRITAALCRDAGEGGVASFVEVAGAALALVVTAPLLRAVLDTLSALL